MILVYGGAYQGKLDYVINTYSVGEEDICRCREEGLPDFSKRVITDLENFALNCVKSGLEPEKEILKHDLSDCILVACDISCGIVPTDQAERAWREANGRMITTLASKADSVIRIFCGLPHVLK